MSVKFSSDYTEKWLRQGEIISDIPQPLPINIKKIDDKRYEIENKIAFQPYSVVISQDCDLEWDFKDRVNTQGQRSLISGIMFCELMTAEELFQQFRNDKKKRSWDKVLKNQNFRFQFFEGVKAVNDKQNNGLPEFVADFKKYYTLPVEFVYYLIENSISLRRTKLLSPYLESFTQRFFFYQSRIALPVPLSSENEN